MIKKTSLSDNTKPAIGVEDETQGPTREIARRSGWETTIGNEAVAGRSAEKNAKTRSRDAEALGESTGSDGFGSDDSFQLEAWSSDDDSRGPFDGYADEESERLARQLQEEEYMLAKAENMARNGNQEVAFQSEERTRQAIAAGTSVLVQCIHCHRWMRVANNAEFMFCPVCEVVSPVQEMKDEMQVMEDHELAERLQNEERQDRVRDLPVYPPAPASCYIDIEETHYTENVTGQRNGRDPAGESDSSEGEDLSDMAIAMALHRKSLSAMQAETESERFARELQEQEYALARAHRQQSEPPNRYASDSTVEIEDDWEQKSYEDPADEGATNRDGLADTKMSNKIESDDPTSKLRSERSERMIEKGLCPSCGRRLYEVKKCSGFSLRRGKNKKVVRIPLTIEGEVVRGQCMHCTQRDEDVEEEMKLDKEEMKISPKPSKGNRSKGPQKYTYKGKYDKYGKKTGQGVLRWSNGDTYEGGFENDMMEGQGKLLLADGSEYDGWWEANKMHGHGTRRFPSGNVYTGHYSRGQRSGRGTLYFSNGDMYEGEWANDAMDGQGQYFYDNGHSFEGTFRNGKRAGRGEYRLTDGQVDICIYKDDKREGEGVRWSANRKKAWKLLNGKVKGKISLEEAARIEEQCGCLSPQS